MAVVSHRKIKENLGMRSGRARGSFSLLPTPGNPETLPDRNPVRGSRSTVLVEFEGFGVELDLQILLNPIPRDASDFADQVLAMKHRVSQCHVGLCLTNLPSAEMSR